MFNCLRCDQSEDVHIQLQLRHQSRWQLQLNAAKRCKGTWWQKRRFSKMTERLVSLTGAWREPDLLPDDVLIIPASCMRRWGRRQAVKAAAVLYLTINPSLHVEHLAPSPHCWRKHREPSAFTPNCLNCTDQNLNQSFVVLDVRSAATYVKPWKDQRRVGGGGGGGGINPQCSYKVEASPR